MSYGKSLSLTQNAFIDPPTDDSDVGSQSLNRRRQATVYDAVAGRVAARGFLSQIPVASRHRDRATTSTVAVRPEEVLFRRQNAPARYEEHDFYFAHERLPTDCSLPSSDILHAIHAYASDYYKNATVNGGVDDYRTMDETALISMGILLEEMAEESLGETGDLVLVEGEEVDELDDELSPTTRRKIRRRRSVIARGADPSGSGEESQSSRRKQKRKQKTPRLVSNTNNMEPVD